MLDNGAPHMYTVIKSFEEYKHEWKKTHWRQKLKQFWHLEAQSEMGEVIFFFFVFHAETVVQQRAMIDQQVSQHKTTHNHVGNTQIKAP